MVGSRLVELLLQQHASVGAAECSVQSTLRYQRLHPSKPHRAQKRALK